jgi:hypothetical protein
MNNIFKVIWNHATQTWTAVGELASAKGKSKSVKLAAISTALLAFTGSVLAASGDVILDTTSNGGLLISTKHVTNQFKGSDQYVKGVKAATGEEIKGNKKDPVVYSYDGIAIGNGAISGANKFLKDGKIEDANGGNGHVAIGLMSRALGGGSDSPSVALGAYAVAEGQGNTALGGNAYSRGINAVAVGRLANATNDGSTALGSETKADWQATAVGNASKAEASKATALGSLSHAQSNSSIAIGRETNVSGQAAVGIGSRTKVIGSGSAVVGNDSSVSSANVSTLGSNITVAAGRDGAVVLGHGSDAGADTTKVIAVNSTTAEGSPLVYSGFAGNLGGKDETGTNNKAASKQGNFVSVGSANGGERQIKHIAAGEITADSTDAINGSQLYRVAETLGKAANQTANALGVTLNKDGTLSGFSQPLTTAEGSNYTAPPAAGDVKTALTNLNNYVNAGWNIAASGNDYENNVSVGHTVNFVGTGNVDVDGSTIDGVRTVNISVDSPLDYASTTTTTPDGKTVNVAKASDGKWYPVDENGDIKENAQPVEASKIDKKGAKLTDSDTENHPYEKGNAYTYDDEGNITATGYDKTKPESKDKITAGKNGVQLNNVGWATQPDQAVNKDQLDQTVNKSGFYVQQNGKSTLDGKTSSDKVSDTEKVTPNDVVNFADGDGTVVKVKTERDENGVDTTTVSVDVDAKKVIDKVKGNVTAAKVDGDDAGKVTVADSDKGKLATVDTVKDAINSSFWTARVENNDKQVVKTADNSANATIKAGSNVAFVAGKNLVANQTTTGDNTVFTYGLADKIEVSKITVKPAAGEEDKGTTVENGKVTNLDDHLTAPAKVTGGNVVNATEVKTPILTDAEKKEAATVNDVLNAGWNLKTNGNQAAAITNGKGLDFASDDNSVTITPTVDKDGNAKVNFSVNATSVINNNKGSIKEAATDPKAANAGKVTVSDADKGKLATVDTVAKAINSAATFVKVADSQEVITTSTANDNGVAVKSGDTVTHTAGKNLKVKRDGKSVTYALAQDIDVNSVKAKNGVTIGSGDNATTITSDDKGLNLAGKNGAATNINNVKDADLNSTSKQAVNGSQLHATNEKVANLGTTVNNLNSVVNRQAGAIDNLNRKVNKHSKQARAGIAGANAAAALPQAYTPGRAMVAAAAGTFKGQNALAVGYSRISDNGKVILKLQGNANTSGDVGAGVGVGYQW